MLANSPFLLKFLDVLEIEDAFQTFRRPRALPDSGRGCVGFQQTHGQCRAIARMLRDWELLLSRSGVVLRPRRQGQGEVRHGNKRNRLLRDRQLLLPRSGIVLCGCDGRHRIQGLLCQDRGRSAVTT